MNTESDHPDRRTGPGRPAIRTAALLTASLALLALTGCGVLRAEGPPSPGTAEETGSPAAPAERPAPEEAPAAGEGSAGGGPALEEAPTDASPVPDGADPEDDAPEIPADGALVLVTDYIPDLLVDLRYATENNFTGQRIYDFSDAYLRYGTVKKLSAVQEALAAEGLGLKLWDAFRPAEAQFRLWEVCPDGRYVADPRKGFSSHSRGNTVDLTLVDGDGEELVMPTGFDDFTARADRDYSDVEEAAAENARLLEDAMTAAGFRPYFGEWWHFSDQDGYEVEVLPPAGSPNDDTGGNDHG